MLKKALCLIIVAIMAISSFVACSDSSGKIMQIGDVSADSTELSNDGEVFVAESDYISEALFNYLFKYLKDSNLNTFKQYENMGYQIAGNGVKVGDTEEFWNSVYKEEDDGTKVTFGEELYNSVVAIFEDILALEAVAQKYGYKLPDTYDKGLDETIAQQIVALNAEIFKDTSEITDEDGKVFKWAKDRWAMNLMKDGISAEAWERVFYLYPSVIIKDITTQLEAKGVIEAEEDSVLIEKGEKELKDRLDNFMKTSMKIKYIAYKLKDEKATDETAKSSDSTDASTDEVIGTDVSSEDTSAELSENSSDELSEDGSEDVSEDSSEDTSEDISDDLSPAEYNKALREKCKKIYEGISNGSLNIDDEIKKSDIADKAEAYPDGIVGTFEQMKGTFGESTEGLKIGDVKMYEYGGAIHIIQVQELAEKDSGFSTELTDDDIEALRAQSVSAAFEELLNVYKKGITKNEALLEKYKKPWTIN